MKYPTDIYMSPRVAIQRFYKILNRCHPEALKLGNNSYKEEREAVVAATVLLGIENQDGKRAWLQNAEHIYQNCDIKAIVWNCEEKGDFEEKYMWQITEFESHTGNFIDAVRNKQKPGHALGKLDLIINVRDKGGWMFYPEDLAGQINREGSKYKSVWLVCDDISSEWVYNVVQLTPQLSTMKFDIEERFGNSVGPDFIRIGPKYGKYTPVVGEYLLPLPPCPICGSV